MEEEWEWEKWKMCQLHNSGRVTCKSVIIIYTFSKCDDTKQTMLIFLYLHFARQFALCLRSFIFMNVERITCMRERAYVCVCNGKIHFDQSCIEDTVLLFSPNWNSRGQKCNRKKRTIVKVQIQFSVLVRWFMYSIRQVKLNDAKREFLSWNLWKSPFRGKFDCNTSVQMWICSYLVLKTNCWENGKKSQENCNWV